MPGRATSSLRAARAPTYRSHVPSSRPTKRATNRFSANFADDDDDGMEEDQGGLRADELEQWAKSTGTGLVVPTGWSFKTVDAAKPTDAEAVAAEPSKVLFNCLSSERSDFAHKSAFIRVLRTRRNDGEMNWWRSWWEANLSGQILSLVQGLRYCRRCRQDHSSRQLVPESRPRSEVLNHRWPAPAVFLKSINTAAP